MANIQGFGIQLATGGFSLEANTIFATYAEALAYAQSAAAYVGKVISVTSGDQKGLYTIEAVGENASFKKVGSDIDLSNYVTKGEISAVYKAKGSVATFEELPTNAQVGDVYNVTATGKNYVWVENLVDGESGWDDLAGIVDLTPYATTASVEGYVATLNGDIAKNAADILTLNTEISNKVDAAEGYSLIAEDKLALIDTNAAEIQALEDKNLDSRISTLEGMFKSEDGTIDLSDITNTLNGHSTRIGNLESGKVDTSDFNTLSGTVSEIQGTLAEAVALNAEQTGYINSLQESVTTLTNTYNSGIQGLTATVNSHTEAIGKNTSDLTALTTVVNTINGDYLKAADIVGKLDASVYETKVAELVKADEDNLQTAKDYDDTAAGLVNTALAEEIARAQAAEQAVADAVQAEADRIDAILTGEGVSEAVESFKELQTWIENHEGGAADILTAANKAQEEVDALELVVAGIDAAYKAADEAVLSEAKGHVATELAKLGTAAYKAEDYFASATALASVKTTADAAAPQATTYTKDEVNSKIADDIAAAFEWVDVK
jgi:hypothetical protein